MTYLIFKPLLYRGILGVVNRVRPVRNCRPRFALGALYLDDADGDGRKSEETTASNTVDFL